MTSRPASFERTNHESWAFVCASISLRIIRPRIIRLRIIRLRIICDDMAVTSGELAFLLSAHQSQARGIVTEEHGALRPRIN